MISLELLGSLTYFLGVATVTNEEQILDEVYRKWIRKGIVAEPMTAMEYETAVAYIYRMLKIAPPKSGYRVFQSRLEAWKAVCEIEATSTAEYNYLVERPIWPLSVGMNDAGIHAAIEACERLGKNVTADPDVRDYICLHKIGYVWPLDEVCIFCEPPTILVNDQGDLHCEDGPAVNFHGHEKFWFINGIECDQQIVETPQTQTLEQLLGDKNADRQAIRIDRKGWLWFLQETGATVLDEGPNDLEGTYEVLFDSPHGRRLVPTCITGKIPALGVPNTVNTCAEAQLWLHRGKKRNVVART